MSEQSMVPGARAASDRASAQPSDHTGRGPARESAEEPRQDPGQEPVQEPVREPAEEPVQDPARESRQGSLADLVDQPAKVMRIGTMVKQLLDEVRSAPLDDAARNRLATIHERSIAELEDGLAPELVEELHRITLPFTDDAAPSDGELRIAQAQLVGWLEGLFHGIQAAMAAQAMANQQAASRAQMRQLPPGTLIAPGVVIGENGEPQHAPAGTAAQRMPEGEGPTGPGQYL